jgi:hypothetical protein
VAAVALVDTTGKTIAMAALNGTREVVLAPAAPLAPGATAKVTVQTSLKDKDGRSPAGVFELRVQ